jgi:SAM-dependent methyltransferase
MESKNSFLLEIFLDEEQSSRQGYNSLYEQTSLSQTDIFYRWLLKKRFKLPKQGKLLDVACGAGEFVQLAGQHGLWAVGCDISEVVARTALQRIKSQGWMSVSEGETLPFANDSFDFITNIGSLEHFINLDRSVQEMARVLKPSGNAYILVPNTFSLLCNVWIAFRQGITSIDDQPVQRYGARMDWINLLENNGLHVIKTMKYERAWPQTLADWGHYLKYPKELIRVLLGPIIPTNLAFCFIFECKKAPPREAKDKNS